MLPYSINKFSFKLDGFTANLMSGAVHVSASLSSWRLDRASHTRVLWLHTSRVYEGLGCKLHSGMRQGESLGCGGGGGIFFFNLFLAVTMDIDANLKWGGVRLDSIEISY